MEKDIRRLKEPYRAQALENKKNQVFGGFDLLASFDWERSKQGFDYWEDVHDNFENHIVKEVTTDSIVLSVREDLNSRSLLGIDKYKTTLDREDLTELQWLQHAYEEGLDQCLYLKKLIKMKENEL